MSKQLGPIDMSCDAPPYPIVHACERLGFRSPLDVRWCRLSHFPFGNSEHEGLNPWKWFAVRSPDREKQCLCGAPLPLIENYAFTLASERVIDYRLGQCQRCLTVFWEEE